MINIIHDTFAVIVLYKCQISESLTLSSLNRSLSSYEVSLPLLIYDNSPEALILDPGCESLKKFDITYIHDKENGGLGKAYNMASKYASEKNKNWLLVLDQDTNLDKEIFFAYNQAVNSYKEISMFVPLMTLKNGKILSPCSFRYYYGSHLKNVDYGKQEFNTNSVINSGILVTLSSFQKVGGYNEKIKLDLSDHQFIEKYKQLYKQYVVIESTCIQNFSAVEDRKEKQIVRFKYYCQGIYYFEARQSLAKVLMTSYLFLKLIKKSVQFKSIAFFKIFYKELLRKAFT